MSKPEEGKAATGKHVDAATQRQAEALLVGRFESPKERSQRLIKELDEAEALVLAQIERDRSGIKSGSAASTLQARQLLRTMYQQDDINHGRSGREGDE